MALLTKILKKNAKKVADAYKNKPKKKATPKKATPKKDKTAAEALGKGQRPTPKQVEQSNLPNKPKVKATVRSQAAKKAAAERAKPGVGKKDIETGKYGGTSAGARAKTAAKNVKTRVKRNPGKAAAATATGAVGTAALMQDKPKVTQAKPQRLKDVVMESPKPKAKKAAPKPKPKATPKAKKPVSNKDWIDPDTGLKASESKVETGGILRDSEGRPVRDGSGKVIRTRYKDGGAVMKTCAGCKSPMACKKAGKCLAKGYSKGGAVRKKKPTGYMCGGHAKKKMAKGGAVRKPKGCGMAMRGYGKAMKK